MHSYTDIRMLTSEVPNLCSAEPYGLRVHFPGALRPLQENTVLVVVENKLRYYGKFQSFLKYNFIAWTLRNCLDISLLYIPLLSFLSPPP